jgi:DivIVA domain-containing protein
VIVFLALVLVVLAGLVVALVLGRWGGGEAMVAPTSTSPFEPLPEGRLDADRAREVRFDIGLRGYRMDQVDSVLDRLVPELRSRDEELVTLRSGAAGPPGAGRTSRTRQADRAGQADPAHQADQAGAAEQAGLAERAGLAEQTGRAERAGRAEPVDHADRAVER